MFGLEEQFQTVLRERRDPSYQRVSIYIETYVYHQIDCDDDHCRSIYNYY